MLPILSWSSSVLALGGVFALVLFSTKILQPAWWRSAPVRIAIFLAMLGVLTGLTTWLVGQRIGSHSLVLSGCGLSYVGLLVLGPAAVMMPLGAVIDRGLARLVLSRRSSIAGDRPPDPSAGLGRRALIRAGGATLPALGAAAGVDGFASAKEAPRMPLVRLAYEGLHPDLHGLRILHLSDIHLGGSIPLERLEVALRTAFAAHRPDLVVVTGDIADDPSLLGPAMELVARMSARCGAFVSLGNHEYLHDIAVTRAALERSPVPLLVSSGRTLVVGRARLYVAGADDPVHMHGDIEAMLRPSIEEAASRAPAAADFRLLLCHRPEGLGPASEVGFDLVLSGHTHGGQLGLFGRSLLEAIRPGIGWWGRYERARRLPTTSRLATTPTRLYTTSGFGHWFPFRVGCPTELPVVVLERAEPDGAGMTTLSRSA
ncbi:MAG: metallophosphoesterase [Deltaproteobacteria bacterium]|nr:metallophosphoesterase [Deltaproteobacteria bacterium]